MELTDLVAKTLSRRRGDGSLRIVQAGHPALRQSARAWSGQLPAEQLADLVEAMAVTMREAPGVGLAAPQVGIPLALMMIEDRFAADDEEDDVLRRRPVPLRVLLDPVYEVEGTRRAFFWEGCLSVDGWQSIVPRSAAVRARATERRTDGSLVAIDERWDGWAARIFQHETDHLAGTLCHDLAVPRSFVEARYTEHYADLPEAVRRLGLTGDVARLRSGEVEIG